MNESETLRSAVVKTLAVVGFLATLTLVVFLLVTGMKHAPSIFSSLSAIMNNLSINTEKDEFTIATDKTVVNSGESFQITWTEASAQGEYKFTYSCDGGVTLEVRSADGKLVPMKCDDTLTLTDEATGLSLSPTSNEIRFSDVKLNVAFHDTEKDTSYENTIKVTVVNAAIPFKDTEETATEDAVEEEPATEHTTRPTTPVVASPYPASNPQGYTDLQMSIVGSGILRNGVFSLSPSYNYNINNALRFDVKNVGTKRGDTWHFSIVLPNGEVYTSKTQIALGPQEHIEFTLGFFVNKEDGTSITLTPTLYTASDTNAVNNSKSVTIPVK